MKTRKKNQLKNNTKKYLSKLVLTRQTHDLSYEMMITL